MRVTVDDDRCRGHAVCCSLCPAVFELTDAGYTVARLAEVPAEHEDLVRAAAGSCPERAITVS
jgi:ferredoxin